MAELLDGMNLVFCGTPHFAVPTLETLLRSGFDIQLVVTQPDRPRGRGMELTTSPVKQSALKHNLPMAQPERIKNNSEFRAQLAALRADAFIVVGYGRIIPKWMLDLPRFGNINLHASLLPKYRGAAPIQWAIAKGERVTGVTTMLLNEGLDTGDILMQRQVEIRDEDTAVTLAPRLAQLGAELVVTTLRKVEKNEIMPRPQDHQAASLAPILSKENGRLCFSWTAQEIYNRLRGFQPWPGVFTTFRGKQLTLIKARPEHHYSPSVTGEWLVVGHRLFVGCGSGTILELLELQIEGKKPVAARDFIHGYRMQSGEKLG